jgi:hypothetical protein
MALQELHAYTTELYQVEHKTGLKSPIKSKSRKSHLCLMISITVILWSTTWPNINSAYGVSRLTSVSSSTLQATSGKFLLAPVSTTGAANPQSALTLNMSAKNDYFYLKNFGNYTLSYFSMTQTLASTTIRYCVNQNFKGGSYTKCADNSNPFTVGNTMNLGRIQFNTPLTPGAAFHFSVVSTNNGTNVISVTTKQNDLLNPNGTVFNS